MEAVFLEIFHGIELTILMFGKITVHLMYRKYNLPIYSNAQCLEILYSWQEISWIYKLGHGFLNE